MSYITSFKIALIVCSLTACTASTYSNDYLGKYKEAVAKYQAKDYYKARQLFKEVIPKLKGKKEIIAAEFYQAYAAFYEGSYKISAHYFEEFYKAYPRVKEAEEALYMQGYANYLDLPDIRLDQTKTKKVLLVLQSYLKIYPTGLYTPQVCNYIVILQDRLVLKILDAAKLYYKLGKYESVAVVLKNLKKEPGAYKYAEEIAYLKIKLQYKSAVVTCSKDDKRLHLGLNSCQEFLNSYSDSKYLNKVKIMNDSLISKINQ